LRAENPKRQAIRVNSSPTFENIYQSGQINYGQLVKLRYGIEAGDVGDVNQEDRKILKDAFKSVWEA